MVLISFCRLPNKAFTIIFDFAFFLKKKKKIDVSKVSKERNQQKASSTQVAFTCSKLRIETLEQCVKYVQS